MQDDAGHPLTDILRSLGIFIPAPYDLEQGSPKTVLFLAEVATELNTLAVADFGGRLGQVRQEGLLEQVIGAAFQSFGGVDPHPGAFAKAAMLLRGITAGHPFQDGNKRTGPLLVTFYLDALGYQLPTDFDVDQSEDLCLRISAGALRDIGQIATALRGIWRKDEVRSVPLLAGRCLPRGVEELIRNPPLPLKNSGNFVYPSGHLARGKPPVTSGGT